MNFMESQYLYIDKLCQFIPNKSFNLKKFVAFYFTLYNAYRSFTHALEWYFLNLKILKKANTGT